MALTTLLIAQRFLAVGGRFMIDPDGHLDFGINVGGLLADRSLEAERGSLLRRARAARGLWSKRPAEIANLVRQNGRDDRGWLVWTATPFRLAEAAWQVAETRFKALPASLEAADPAAFEQEEDRMHAAWFAAIAAPVTDWSEFADCFAIACDDGNSVPDSDTIKKLLGEAIALSKKEGR